MPEPYHDLLLEINQRRVEYGAKFNRTFGVSIQKFWDITTGFDVVKFDEWLKTPDGKSTREWIVETKGEAAAELIVALIGIK